MSDFKFYITQGIYHILDLNGLDHFYFILSFCLLYSLKNWKDLLGLVTAFTIGHSITLILAGLDFVKINPQLVESLIPITILISCFNNFYQILNPTKYERNLTITYIILFLFGLIHGLGFSTFLKMMLFDDSILVPLLGFNIGIELAQLIIVLMFLIILWLLNLIPIRRKSVLLTINTVVTFLVIFLMIT